MSESSLSTTLSTRNDVDPTVIETEPAVQAVLDALRDPDCRAILDATGDEALSARELSERCGLPLSTTYRKVDTLLEGSLLEERTRVGRSGKHPNEYACLVTRVVVSMGAVDGPSIRVAKRRSVEDSTAPRG